MAVRIVEWKLPYTWGTGIGIDTNKVISLLLREENNLIMVNEDNQIYTDLQLADWIEPTDTFPVGVTVGKVLAEDWRDQNGLILNRKTTSGDYARWLYWADGEIYFDWGTGTFKQVYYSDEVNDLFTALRGDLATVAFTWDYNDLINRPQFLQVQADWDQSDSNQPDFIKNKPTIPTVNDATLTIQKNNIAQWTFTANSSTNTTINIPVPNVINNLTSTSTSDALSAYQWNVLDQKIQDLQGIGRFLSLWNAATGQPISFPLSTPYNYQTWDYFLVETVSTASTPVNYKPNGNQYTEQASTIQETDELEIWDLYIYDGTVWLLQINHGKTVSFANLAWQPSDNAALDSALDAKADVSSLATVATSGDYGDLLNKPTIPAAQVNSDWNANSGVAQILNKPTIPTATSQLNNDSWFITSSYHDSSKQDTLSAGTGISITSNTVSNTWVTSVNSSTWAVTVNDVKVATYTNAPSTPTEWMVWYDTTNNLLKSYNWSDRKPCVDTIQSGLISKEWGKVNLRSINWTTLIYNPSLWESSNITVSEFSPWGTATTGYVVTKTNNGYEWAAPSGWDVMVSSQSNNILTSWMKIWAWTQANYEALWSYDNNTVYLTI